jgi:hypothetical protein
MHCLVLIAPAHLGSSCFVITDLGQLPFAASCWHRAVYSEISIKLHVACINAIEGPCSWRRARLPVA